MGKKFSTLQSSLQSTRNAIVSIAVVVCNAIFSQRFRKRIHIRKTENEGGFSNSRFSQAIDYIENDSNNELDIIYFLPAGDMGDLVLRSKMRTIATHFSGDNFPKTQPYRTSKRLNVYLAYDEKLIKFQNSNKQLLINFQILYQERRL